MTELENRYQELVSLQQQYYKSGKTLSIENRIGALQRLKKSIQNHEKEVEDAMKEDLGKGPFETYFGEMGGVYIEIDYQIKHLKQWAKPKSVGTPLALFAAKSEIHYEPYGTVLVLSPWNYPFQLAIMPLIGAIAAGNTVIIKPSEFSVSTSKMIEKIVEETFEKEYVAVVQGAVEETTALLKQRFDFIFFTGSSPVGRIVMTAAAQHLTPVVLELGGKSPVILDETANMEVCVRRLCFGKISNCGQTCVAPDYIFVHESRKMEFLNQFEQTLYSFFSNGDLKDVKTYHQMARVINQKNYLRLKSLIEDEKVVIGGYCFDEQLKMSPTVVDCGNVKDYLNGKKKSRILEEEIFGPILPVITYSDLDDVISYIKDGEKPLALYIFSENEEHQDKILSEVSFGGGCINDTLVHLANEELPFGGVGNSGMGHYHGKYSFETFSHEKAIIRNNTKVDVKVRYMPYTEKNYRLLRKLFK